MAAVSPPRTFVAAAQPPRQTPAPSTMRTVAQFMVFLALGLMVGAAVGYMLFPIEWTALLPRDTTQERQYVVAVADKYWHTLDAVEAQKQLSRMDTDQVTQLMGAVLRETKNPETRTHIAALAQALDLYPDASPFAEFLSHPMVLLAILASLVPIAAGFQLVIVPTIRERRREQAAEAGIDEQPAETNPENSATQEAIDAALDALPGQPGAAPVGATAAENNGEPAPLPPLQTPVPEETEEEAEEHAAEEKGILKDLASLFEEEDVSLSALEGLVKNLPDIHIDEIKQRVSDISNTLRDIIHGRLRRSAQQ